MKAATALIADDEAHLAEHLRARLAALWPELSILPVAANGLEALRAIDDEAPTVAFLDIRMPGLTGLEVAHRMDRRTHVVFVTAYDQYAVDAFDRDAVDYLVKPIADDRLARTLERLRRKIAEDDKPPAMDEVLERIARALPAAGGGGRLRWIRASQGDTVRQIAVDDVLYFQASDKYTCVITREGESLIRTPLAELVPQLDGDTFWQVHRSTVVNMNAVASTRRDIGGRVFVKLKDGNTELAVSRAYAHLFKQM
jgi:DNA-binding LytR/AlgR family response regulator